MGEWIKCGDGTPEMPERNVFGIAVKALAVRVMCYDGHTVYEGQYFSDSGFTPLVRGKPVTYWSPMPAPPED